MHVCPSDQSKIRHPAICEGSPAQIGLAQGRALREQIRAAPAVLRRLEAFRLLKPPLLPMNLFRWLAARRAQVLWRKQIARLAPTMAERLEGIAAGADTSLALLQLLNILEPFMSDLRAQTTAGALGGCSAIAVTGRRATGGEPVVARNFDYLPVIQPLYAMRDTRPDGGLRSIDFTVAPLAGAVDGMNEAGLCITNNYAFVRDRPSYARPISMIVSDALASCTTVDEATELFLSTPRWGGGILMLADARGDIAAVELSNRACAVRRPLGNENVLFHSNRFCADAMREAELPEDARYTERAPTPLRGTLVHQPSLVRDKRFAGLIEGGRQIGPGDLARIMADHGPDEYPSADSICMHSDYWFTTATLQFYPCSRRVRVAFDSACTARWMEFSLGGHRADA